MKKKHAVDSSLKQNQHDQSIKLRRRFQEPTPTHDGETSCIIFPYLSEENSSQVESLTCWICQEEFTSKDNIIQHYHDHMR